MSGSGLLFTDPHITPNAEFSQPTSDGLTTYLHRCIESFDWLHSEVERLKPSFVACNGDVTETTGFVDSRTLKVATKLFDDLADRVLSIGGVLYVLTGNHDTWSTLHNIHNLEFLRHIDGLVVLDKPQFVEEHEFYAIPWVEDLDTVEIDERAKFVLSHMDVKGGFLHKTKKSDFGVNPAEFANVPVFNGHQHNPQLIGDSFYNIGAFTSRSFHDVDSPPRGATHVMNTGKHVIWEHHENPHDIPFKDIIIADDITAAQWKKKLDDGESGYENAYVRVKYAREYKSIAEQVGYLSQGSRTEPIPDDTKISINTEAPKPISADDVFDEYLGLAALNDKLESKLRNKGREYLRLAASNEISHSLPIEFEYVDIQQFQSIGHIVLDLTKNGLWYVWGSNEDDAYDANGVGKSSLHEAIYWCLTDRSLRGYTGDEVIHWDKEWVKVEIGLKVGDKRYKIRKTRKHPEFKTNTSITVLEGDEWTDISARRKTDTKDIVKKLLGRTDKVLQHSVFFTSGLSNRFTALSYPARVKLIEEVTDSEIYGKAYKLIKADADEGLGALHFLRGVISEKKESIAQAEEDLEEVKDRLVEYTQKAGPKLLELKEVLRGIEEKGRASKIEVEQKELELSKVREKSGILDSKISTIVDKFRTDSITTAKLETFYGFKKSVLDDYLHHLKAGKCETCGQTIGAESHYHTDSKRVGDECNAAFSEHIEASQGLERLGLRKADLSKLQDTVDTEMEVIQGSIAEANKILSKSNELKGELMDAIRKQRSKLSNLKTEQKTYLSIISSAKKELEEKQKELTELESEQEQLAWLEDAFHTTGIRAHLLFQHSLPFLNSRLIKHSVKMGQPCTLNWKENKKGELEDKIDVVFDSKRTYKGASKGEKMMADLSVQSAFNDLAIATGGSHINLLVADEVIDHLDETSVVNFVDILLGKSKNMHILLMAHRPFLESLIPDKLPLVKRGGFTEIQTAITTQKR